MLRAVLAASMVAVAGCAAQPAPTIPAPTASSTSDAGPLRPRPIRPDRGDCEAVPIASAPFDVGALRFEDGFELIARSSLFGGLSGLAAVDASRLLAVTDSGALVTIDPSTDGGVRCAISELRDADGRTLYGKERGDAEDLALIAPDRIAVSFEREHRVAVFTLGDRLLQDGPAIDFAAASSRLESNRGLEALAIAPSGALLAGAERPTLLGGGQPVWRIPVGTLAAPRAPSFAISAASGFALVGLDATPGGGLVVLQRFYSDGGGFRARVGWLPPGVAETATGPVRMRELALLDGDGLPVDNFEGIAALRGDDGRTVVWIVSDDNFSRRQKTLLYRFSFDETSLMEES